MLKRSIGASLVGTIWIAAWLALFTGPLLAADADMDPQTGYRIANYRSPVKLPPEGGKHIDLAALDKLKKDGAVLVDTMPARAGYDPKTGKWRIIEQRDNIPDSTWLPNTGMGKLDPRLAGYFEGWLTKLTDGKKDRPLVFYCLADCWMSWNAVKRASSLGYKNVYWYADGSDGWFQAGRDLVRVHPPPVPELGKAP